MFITRKHLPRRTFLKGVGVTMALPLLDSMVPARTLLAQTAAKPVSRLGFVYVPHGAIMDKWTPATEGAGFEFTPILKPLEAHRNYVNVVSGLGHKAADSTAVHSLSPTTWLSGVRPKATQGVDAFAGITADQIAAQAIGQDSPLPSMELATEDHSGLIGSCDVDYGCIYMNTLSWRTPTTPQPMEINPRKVFERMFGEGGSAAERVARIREDRSILDAIAKEAAGLQLQLGPSDRQTMSQYLENVREIERRIQRAEKSQGEADLQLPSRPAGVPFDFEEHVRLMYELMTLAYQAQVTRVITFMVSREVSNRTYTQVGVSDGHHAISHHQNRAEKMEKNVRIQTFNVNMFGEFLTKLKETPDGDGSLLDHTVLLYGSNMSNSNAHDHFPLPNLVVGGGAGSLKGGRHLRYPDHTPMTNLLVSMLDKAGVRQETLGDSTGAAGEPLTSWGRLQAAQGRLKAALTRKNTDANQPRYARRGSLVAGTAAFAQTATPPAVSAGEARRRRQGRRVGRGAVDAAAQGRSERRRSGRHDGAALGRAQRRRDAGGPSAARGREGRGRQPLRRDGAAAGVRAGRPGDRRAAAQGRREREPHRAVGRNSAARLRARRATWPRPKCWWRAARRSNAVESWRGQTPDHVGGGAGPRRDGRDAGRGRCRRERALGHHRVGAAAHVGATRQVAAARRVHAAAVRRARRPRGRGQERSSRRVPTSARSIPTGSPRSSSPSSTATSTSPTCSSTMART